MAHFTWAIQGNQRWRSWPWMARASRAMTIEYRALVAVSYEDMVTLEQLRHDLAAILAEEETPTVDWPKVASMCLALTMRARGGVEGWDNSPHEIWQFMADCDIRQQDPQYAERQRAVVRRFLAP